MKSWILYLINMGINHSDDPADKRRVRLFNLIGWTNVVVAIPLVAAINLIAGDYMEVFVISGILVVLLVGLYFNSIGYNQPITIVCILLSQSTLFYISLITTTQVGAPYGHLLIGLASVLLVKRRWIRIGLLSLSILAFMIANYIQLKYHTFDEIEYAVVLVILSLIFLIIIYYDWQMVNYQETIKSQGKRLLLLEKQKHEKELELKQKDIEIVVARASMRDKLAKNLTKRLQEVFKCEDQTKALRSVINDLQAQKDVIIKQSIETENIKELSAEFHHRLLSLYPDLTKSDLELCNYLKLNLSNKEIAGIKNSTENSVNVSKARLRKKMGLSSNKELVAIVRSF